LPWQQAVCRCGSNNGLVGLRQSSNRNRWQMFQEHSPTDDRRDLAMPRFVPLLMRADMLAHQFGKPQGSHRQRLDCSISSVHALDRKSGKPEPAPTSKSGLLAILKISFLASRKPSCQ
jgi:hypothetical protein